LYSFEITEDDMEVEIKVGLKLKVETKTFANSFGTCIWEILQTGIRIDKGSRKGRSDGVRVKLLGGSGASVVPGHILVDSAEKLRDDIKNGIAKVISDKEASGMSERYAVGPNPLFGKEMD